MRVLICLQNYHLGGSERRYYNIACYLAKHSKHDITLVTTAVLRDTLCSTMQPIPPQLTLITLYERGWQRWLTGVKLLSSRSRVVNKLFNFSVYRLRDYLLHNLSKGVDSSGYDVWHCVRGTGIPGIINRDPKTRLLSSADTEVAQPGHALSSREFRTAILDNSIVELISGTVKDAICHKLELTDRDSNNLRVAPCSFIDYAKIGSSIETPKRKQVVFLGRFHREKNPILFVQVAHAVSKKVKDVKFLMIGDGPELENVRAEIIKLGLDNVLRIEATESPLTLLKESLIYLSLQNRDNYTSQALMEAMACGCAIVASNRGLTYKIVPAKTGVLVDLNVNNIAQAVIGLLSNVEKTSKVGINASNFIRESQNVTKYCDFLVNLYTEINSSNITK